MDVGQPVVGGDGGVVPPRRQLHLRGERGIGLGWMLCEDFRRRRASQLVQLVRLVRKARRIPILLGMRQPSRTPPSTQGTSCAVPRTLSVMVKVRPRSATSPV